MDQVYKVIYSGAPGSPPVKNAQPAILIPTGKKVCVRVRLMQQGFLTRLVVKQTGGTTAQAMVNLWDSSVLFTPGIHNSGDVAGDDVELYEILTPQTTAGTPPLLVVIGQTQGYPFVNQDTGYADNSRFIYLMIDPSATSVDQTTWDVAMTVHRDMS
jgi:hypothetical protein